MEHNLQTKYATTTSKTLTVTGVWYVVSNSAATLPQTFDILILFIALIFLAVWLSFPIVLYFDRKTVTGRTDWSPSKLYYLGFLPGYLGVFAIFLYLHRRHKAFERKELDSEESETKTL